MAIDTTTLMLIMMMSGSGSSNNMMLPLLLLSGGLGGGEPTGTDPMGTLGSVLTPENMMLGMIPGVGMLGKYMIGGIGAVMAGSMLKPKKRYRRRTRVVYRNSSYRRRY